MQISAECRWFWHAGYRTFRADILDWFKDPDLHGCLPGGGQLRNIELTFVKTKDDHWVTFGLEALGDFDSIEYAIQIASVEMTSAEARFHLRGNPDFTGSYPLWLSSASKFKKDL